MAKNTVNDKSKQISIRIPHDVIDGMEALKRPDESNAGFIVTAMRGEIARRQIGGTDEDTLAGMIDQFVRIAEMGYRTKELGIGIAIAAEREIQRAKNVTDQADDSGSEPQV